VVVVCNGCSDRTADVVRRAAPHATLEEIAVASKFAALERGDEVATTFPRLYVDADIVIDEEGLRCLLRDLDRPGVLAAAPRRVLDLSRSSWFVRSYERVWERLSAVDTGLYGRGVLAVTRAGHARIGQRPDVLGDDLYLHHVFADDERVIVSGATAVVVAPRTARALVRRRARAAAGNAELGNARGGTTDTTRTSAREVLSMPLSHPTLTVDVAVFVAITALARLRARRLLGAGDRTWMRDDTSRA
jgi:hypothetical protein